MILTVTLNAALDVTYEVPRLSPHASHRVDSVRLRGGGKGANVARVLAALGEQVVATGLSGGPTGTMIVEDLSRAGVATAFAPIARESRRAVTVVSRSDADATVFNEPGPTVSAEEWSRFRMLFSGLVTDAQVVVLSGSLPPGLPSEAYALLCAAAREARARVVLDSGGPALLAGVASGPDIVKPNAEELGDFEPMSLRSMGADAVVVSKGPEGLYAVTPAGLWTARPPRVLRGNPTGAGDACVAALARGLRDDVPWPEILADAVALSAAAVLAPQAGEADLDAYARLRERVIVRRLAKT